MNYREGHDGWCSTGGDSSSPLGLLGRADSIRIDPADSLSWASNAATYMRQARDVVCFVTDKNRLSDEACINDGDN